MEKLFHERFTIKVEFTSCSGLDDKVKEEIRDLVLYIKQNSLSHASNLRIYVSHIPIEETKNG